MKIRRTIVLEYEGPAEWVRKSAIENTLVNQIRPVWPKPGRSQDPKPDRTIRCIAEKITEIP